MAEISIVVPGTGADGNTIVKDVEVAPGTRVRDVLQATKLESYQLRTEDGKALGPNDDVAPLAGKKLYAAPKMEVGA